ncbi:MAG: alpha/beta hydrolase [Candidatus Saccharibacteria bacterium]|nr:alpha/beta hydrolase [Candidatus Saccharibacteria bacterium]
MFSKIKYEIFKRPLELSKTHDFCESKSPKLTVVFVHGIAATSASFKNTLDYLEGTRSMQDVRFVTFDLLGAGKSYTSDRLEYNFDEQLTALENSIKKLHAKTPLVLVGHSMGTMIATRYAAAHKKEVRELILVSPPIYRAEDIKSPAFAQAMIGFREVMKQKNREAIKSKAFNNEIKNIVSNTKNYDFLVKTTKPTTLIFGDKDLIIATFNIPKLLKENSKVRAIKTSGTHGVSRDKYTKILPELERILNETL